MHGYVLNIEEETLANTDYRRVLYTAHNSQLVLMSLKPGEEIGEEVHRLDQFIRFEAGNATVYIDEKIYEVSADWAVVIPAGSKHNVVNSGSVDLKLYSVYAPPEHRDGVVHTSKEQADANEEHFDGRTTE